MEALSEEMRCGSGKQKVKCQIKFTTVYPIMVNTGLVKNPRNRYTIVYIYIYIYIIIDP